MAIGTDFRAYHDRRMRDPEYRREWEKHAFGHAVALWLVGYRAEHELTQSQLAALVGMPQPQIARLEEGEVEPRMSTLRRIAKALGVDLRIDLLGADTAEPFIVATASTG